MHSSVRLWLPWRHVPVTYVSAKWHRPSTTGMIIGCVVAQVASRRPVTAQTQVRSHANRCVTCGGQRATGTGVTPTTLVSPCHYHSTNAPLSSSSTHCSYQNDKRAKPGNLPKIYALSEIGENWLEKCLYFPDCGQYWSVWFVELCAPHFGVQKPSSGNRFKNI